HARNPLYMDTNFCNLLNIWDKVFGTYQDERDDIKIEYGITREMDSGNFMDVYFGEIVALVKDVVKAPGIKNKFLYVFMPPGWSHTGDHKTAKITKAEYLQNQRIQAQGLVFLFLMLFVASMQHVVMKFCDKRVIAGLCLEIPRDNTIFYFIEL